MAVPFHHNLRRDSAGEGKTNEGASAGMSADDFIFGLDAFLSLPDMTGPLR